MAVEVRKTDPQDIEPRKAFERFVVENDDLLTLEARIGRFNIFDALRISDVEIRHSNFLAFLLDPAESHGQGQLFLKAVLMALFKNAPPDFPISPIRLDGIDLRGVEVKREWQHIDLLITCKEPRFAVVIENKVWSKEHSNQLSSYQDSMKKAFSDDLPVHYIYLTPEGNDPSEEVWRPYSYSKIHGVLKRVRDSHQNAIGDEVLVFLDHYLNLLGTRFMNDPTLDELCQRIYKNHRQAIDLIVQRGKPESPVITDVLSVLKQDARWDALYHSSSYANCVLTNWREWLPSFGPDDHYPACVGFGYWPKERRLVCTPLFLGPMSDADRRKETVSKLRDESTELGFKRGRAGDAGEYVRVFANETILEWSEDDEFDTTTIQVSVKKYLEALHPRLEKLASILKPLFKPS